jgi:hypothetical protein
MSLIRRAQLRPLKTTRSNRSSLQTTVVSSEGSSPPKIKRYSLICLLLTVFICFFLAKSIVDYSDIFGWVDADLELESENGMFQTFSPTAQVGPSVTFIVDPAIGNNRVFVKTLSTCTGLNRMNTLIREDILTAQFHKDYMTMEVEPVCMMLRSRIYRGIKLRTSMWMFAKDYIELREMILSLVRPFLAPINLHGDQITSDDDEI